MLLNSIWGTATEVGGFWQKRAYKWWTRKDPRDELLSDIDNAESFEEWEETALRLDELLGYDLWRQQASSPHYDYRLIYERLQAILTFRSDGDVLGLVGLLRSGLVRNLGNITSPRLFDSAYAGTKLLIEDYITQVALAIEHVTNLPTAQTYDGGWTSQAKLDLLHDTRQAFGRTSLVLQGGAIFGIAHLGVVRALYLRGLLPRIITGTATGALIAALVCIHTEDELLGFLNGEGIDLSAFSKRGSSAATSDESESDDPTKMQENSDPSSYQQSTESMLATLARRTQRYLRSGYFLDINILEECVRDNVGDLTFEEAYARTKRVLNITIPTSGKAGVPNLLNYLTAPNVLVWSAALASNATDTALYGPVTLQCKNEAGEIVPWAATQGLIPKEGQTSLPKESSSSLLNPFSSSKAPSIALTERESPLSRIAELFNVNHFVVSRARPSLLGSIGADAFYTSSSTAASLSHPHPAHHHSHHHRQPAPPARFPPFLLAPSARLVALEMHHRLTQLDTLGLLPAFARNILLPDDAIPGASITLAPHFSAADAWRLLETPTPQSVKYWIRKGERCVWPAVGALKVRTAVEVELDRGYQVVRRRKPLDGDTSSVRVMGSRGSLRPVGQSAIPQLQTPVPPPQLGGQQAGGVQGRGRRRRASSVDQG